MDSWSTFLSVNRNPNEQRTLCLLCLCSLVDKQRCRHYRPCHRARSYLTSSQSPARGEVRGGGRRGLCSRQHFASSLQGRGERVGGGLSLHAAWTLTSDPGNPRGRALISPLKISNWVTVTSSPSYVKKNEFSTNADVLYLTRRRTLT